ncbi:uncharacterized protein LOC62_04G005343 [Vanrija pseudolonga]|uniref:Uncharacterized protein n=1 Tax=Vanrija pseudolonga TaxID=143232 RepID=A0AAF1BL66_9TREE|nr:hypothetical protein LOC62_04G005343 [Vanrija pseudolonga]
MPIDHTAYPHLIDTIVAQCDIPTLLAFRGTSRSFLARVNGVLLSHAALRPWPADGSSDAFVLTTIPAPPRRLPFVPASVRTLELLSDRAVPPDLVRQFTNLHTLRRRRSAYAFPSPPADTTVDFVPCYGSKERVRLNIPPAHRAVIHLKYVHATVPTFDVRVDVSLRELVVVFWPPEADRAKDPVGAAASLAASLARAVDQWNRRLELTIVGLEQFGQRDHRDSPSEVPFFPFFRENRGIEVLFLGVRMVTLQEWWAEIGTRKDVEGVWVD